MNGLTLLRLVAVTGIVAAIADPGCARARRLRLAVEPAAAADRDAATRVRRAVAHDVDSWGEVVDEAQRADRRILVGDAGAVAARLDEEPRDLAVRPSGAALSIAAVGAPARAATGSRVEVVVEVVGVPAGRGRLTVSVDDGGSGRQEAQAAVDTTAGGTMRVVVPWLAVGTGPRTLRLRAGYDGNGAVRAAVAEVRVDIDAAEVTVAVLEARPAWGARFARLALATLPNLRLATEVRPAPGLTVRSGDAAVTDADVMILGGVDALTRADVNAVERAVRDGGRTAVLVLDEPPGPSAPWRRLWPEPFGAPVSAASVQVVDVGGHAWKTREWLPASLSTQARPLAYSDSGSPVIVGRGMGAGRVVAVTALDAWRWRAEDGVAWATGWQALVLRLAADVPPPVGVTTWVAGEGRRRVVHADVRLRPDIAMTPGTTVSATLRGSGSGTGRVVPLWPAGPGRWRGAVAATPASSTTLDVEAIVDGSVVPVSPVVVDVSPTLAPATWLDVRQRQLERGAETVEETDVAGALARWRRTMSVPATERWYVTRQWWFAALVLALLGSEWILRRARRLP